MKPLYHLDRYAHGWVIRPTPGETGVPVNALNQCLKLFGKNAVFDTGICHHLKATNKSPDAVLCVTTPSQRGLWRDEITRTLKDDLPQHAWWRGVDVGSSSAAIFAVLSSYDQLRKEAAALSRKSHPHDADDLGRCLRLIQAFPGWRDRLPEVAAAYPDTPWPAIIAKWDVLAASTPEDQNHILRALVQGSSKATT